MDQRARLLIGVSLSAIAFFLLFLVQAGCKDTVNNYGAAEPNLTDPQVAPAVIWTNPPDGSTGPFSFASSYHFAVQFNKLMNLSSFSSSTVTIEGFEGPASISLTGSAPSSVSGFSNVVMFRIYSSQSTSTLYGIGKTYTVTIDTSVEDLHGKKLSSRYAFSFTPEPTFRVQTVYPMNGDTVVTLYDLYSSTPYVCFNSSINSNILSSIHLSPSTDGKWVIDSYNSRVYYTSLQSFDFNTQYQIIVDQGAKDIAGNELLQQFVSAFKTTSFRVESTSPANGANNVSPTSSYIYIYFNSPLDAASAFSALSFTPAISGTIQVESSRIYLSADVPLRVGTVYTGTVATTLKAKNGVNFPSPFTFSFTTRELEVTSTSPSNGSTSVSPSSYISFSFNAAIDQSTFPLAFSISPSIQGNFTYAGGSYPQATFRPLRNLSLGTTYTVTLSTALKSSDGANLNTPFELAFTTIPFRVTSTYPYNNSTDVSPTQSIQISCSAPVDTSTIRNAFTISPAIAGRFSWSYPSSSFEFIPTNPLRMGATYSVSISTALRSIDSVALQTPYSFLFSTRSFAVSYTTPSSGETSVSRSSYVSVVFNTDINFSTVPSGFSISPSVNGNFSQSGSTGFYFSHGALFAANTIYTVTLSTKIKSSTGDSLSTPYTYYFTTSQY